MSLHNFRITRNDDQRLIFTGILYPNVQAGSGPSHGLIQADPNDRQAYYNDPVVKVNEQDLENWNYLRGEEIWFEHGQHQKKPVRLGSFVDSTITKDRDLFVVGEISKKDEAGNPRHEAIWAAEKIASGELGELSIGYEVIPWAGTNKVRAKRFQEGSVVWKGYLPKTKIAVAASKVDAYKSSVGDLDDSIESNVGYRFSIMASHGEGQTSAGTDAAAGAQPPASSGDAQGNAAGGSQQQQVSTSGRKAATDHHSLHQNRGSDGRFQKGQAAAQQQQQQQHAKTAGQEISEKEALAAAHELELETRLNRERAERDAEIARLKKNAELAEAERKELAEFRKAKAEQLAKEREEAVKRMEEALTTVKKATGLTGDELAYMQAGYRNVAADSVRDKEAVKASEAMFALSNKVGTMSNKLSEQEKALADKEAQIKELMEQVEAAKQGRSIMASRVNQARANLRNTNVQSAAKLDGKGKEEEEDEEEVGQRIQASRGPHGSHIGDILLPLPAVQHNSWEARLIQREVNPQFGMNASGIYGVHASAGPGGRTDNEYEGRTYVPVADHPHSWYTGHGMKDQGPEGRAWFTHLVRHNGQLSSLPTSKKYDLQLHERQVEQEAFYRN